MILQNNIITCICFHINEHLEIKHIFYVPASGLLVRVVDIAKTCPNEKQVFKVTIET